VISGAADFGGAAGVRLRIDGGEFLSAPADGFPPLFSTYGATKKPGKFPGFLILSAYF
jgi:hypothetical protein